MKTQLRIVVWLWVAAFLILGIGGSWSISEAMGERAKMDLVQYHRGTFHFEQVKDPQDRSSKSLYHFIQLIDLEGRNATAH